MIKPDQPPYIHVNNKRLLDFTSNDYLGLKQHPTILDAFITAAKMYGIGSGGSAQVSGYTDAHCAVEERVAHWLGFEKAVLFNSGYHANLGIFQALCHRSSVVLSDKLCHASLIDGIQLSRAKHRRYRHHDMAHLQDCVNRNTPDFIVTEGVFSMEGRIAELQIINQIAKSSQARILLDDAHGIGILGKSGKGTIEHHALDSTDIDCLVAPLGKAFNANGAIVAGNRSIINTLLQFARTYRYTTSLPPALCHAVLASLDVIINETWRRDALQRNIQYFLYCAKKHNLPILCDDETPIMCIPIGDNQRAIALQRYLASQHVHTVAIRPPTVPTQTARLRLSLNSMHTHAQINQLVNAIMQGLTSCQ